MENTFKIFLVVHIISGFTAFVAAPIAMMVAKGGKNHRNYGKIFFWAMTGVCSTGFVMSVMHSILFLFMISGFSYYMVASGYRWIYRKKIRSIKDLPPVDKLLLITAGLFNASLFGYGLYAIINDPHNAFGYIAAVFGGIGLRLILNDIKFFTKSVHDKNAWLLHHVGGMIGGYIATVSAFSAVNFNFLPTIIQWLWPTIIGVPLLTAWINFYKRKFKAGKKAAELVEVRVDAG